MFLDILAPTWDAQPKTVFLRGWPNLVKTVTTLPTLLHHQYVIRDVLFRIYNFAPTKIDPSHAEINQ